MVIQINKFTSNQQFYSIYNSDSQESLLKKVIKHKES